MNTIFTISNNIGNLNYEDYRLSVKIPKYDTKTDLEYRLSDFWLREGRTLTLMKVENITRILVGFEI